MICTYLCPSSSPQIMEWVLKHYPTCNWLYFLQLNFGYLQESLESTMLFGYSYCSFGYIQDHLALQKQFEVQQPQYDSYLNYL